MAALGCVAACGGGIDARTGEGAPAGPVAIADPGASSGSPAPPPGAGSGNPSEVAPAGLGDGICTPGDVTRGLYDPDCVYVLGTTSPGLVGNEVLFHPSAPTRLASGWKRPPHLRPFVRGDQRILFMQVEPPGIFVYAPKEQSPYANSTPVPIPACPGSRFLELVLSPGSGIGGPPGYYRCGESTDGIYHELGSSNAFDVGGDRRVLALDETGVSLVRSTSGATSLVSVAGEQSVSGLEALFSLVAVRSRRGGGFLVAARPNALPREAHLYEVDATTGGVTDRGAYQTGGVAFPVEAVLEPSGALQGWASDSPTLGNNVVRLRLDAPPEVVFDDANSTVRLRGPKLVTGP